MTLSVVPFSLFALLGTFRDVLSEKHLKDLASIMHQGAQETFLYRRHVQHTGTGILFLNSLQECFGLAVAFLPRFLPFFLLSG